MSLSTSPSSPPLFAFRVRAAGPSLPLTPLTAPFYRRPISPLYFPSMRPRTSCALSPWQKALPSPSASVERNECRIEPVSKPYTRGLAVILVRLAPQVLYERPVIVTRLDGLWRYSKAGNPQEYGWSGSVLPPLVLAGRIDRSEGLKCDSRGATWRGGILPHTITATVTT